MEHAKNSGKVFYLAAIIILAISLTAIAAAYIIPADSFDGKNVRGFFNASRFTGISINISDWSNATTFVQGISTATNTTMKNYVDGKFIANSTNDWRVCFNTTTCWSFQVNASNYLIAVDV